MLASSAICFFLSARKWKILTSSLRSFPSRLHREEDSVLILISTFWTSVRSLGIEKTTIHLWNSCKYCFTYLVHGIDIPCGHDTGSSFPGYLQCRSQCCWNSSGQGHLCQGEDRSRNGVYQCCNTNWFTSWTFGWGSFVGLDQWTRCIMPCGLLLQIYWCCSIRRYDNIGYESVFILPVVLLTIDIVMRLVLIEKPGESSWFPINSPHAFLTPK